METSWKNRLDKLLSREAIGGLLMLTLAALALFFLRDAAGNPAVEFGDFCFWGSIFAGIPAGAVTVQKSVGAFLKRGA